MLYVFTNLCRCGISAAHAWCSGLRDRLLLEKSGQYTRCEIKALGARTQSRPSTFDSVGGEIESYRPTAEIFRKRGEENVLLPGALLVLSSALPPSQPIRHPRGARRVPCAARLTAVPRPCSYLHLLLGPTRRSPQPLPPSPPSHCLRLLTTSCVSTRRETPHAEK